MFRKTYKSTGAAISLLEELVSADFLHSMTPIPFYKFWWLHYIDVIMTTMASQIPSLTVVCSTVYSDEDQRKHQSSASLAFVWGIHRDRWIPRTKASYAEKVSIWWRHHVRLGFLAAPNLLLTQCWPATREVIQDSHGESLTGSKKIPK